MKVLWKLTRRFTGQKRFDTKRRVFLLLNCTLSGAAGLAIWLIVRCFALDSPDWMICFTGYPAMLYGYIGGLIFLLNVDDRTEE